MDISRLPRPGADFSLNDPGHGFKRRLSEITLAGEYHNLRNNLDGIIREVEEYEEFIRKGGLSYDQRIRIWNKIRHLDNNLTHEDMLEIKEILEYLGK
jgi:hypothetical protein